MQQKPVVILGGRSLVAPYLMRRLAAAGLSADVISRQPLTLPSGFRSLTLDLTQARSWMVPADALVISIAPLWVLARNLPRFMGAKAVIAVGSTSRFGKAASEDPRERATAEKLREAEAALENWNRTSGTTTTILRPTLIYDCVNDANITRMARVIRRYGVFPIAAPGKGLRQPIHADDVAGAIMGALDNAAVDGKALNIAGGEALTYRAMAERVFIALGRQPRPLLLPTDKLALAFSAATRLGILREKSFGFGVFNRMNEDLVFDCAEGLALLNYAPRPFTPSFPH